MLEDPEMLEDPDLSRRKKTSARRLAGGGATFVGLTRFGAGFAEATVDRLLELRNVLVRRDPAT
jgi:hypothetical protein